MEEFPSNSHRSKSSVAEKPEPKKITPIVTGDVVRRKKPLGKRFAETFIGGNAKNVMDFIVMDVLVPQAKDMAADAFSQGFERLIFGESRSAGRRTVSRGATSTGYTSYNRYAPGSIGALGQTGGRREDPRQLSRRGRAEHNFDEIVLDTRVEADAVIDNLFELVSKYESATVADLYELVGISGNFTDTKYGWTELLGADVRRTRGGGYLLDLPKPVPLD